MNRSKIAISAIHQLQRQLQDAPEYTANEVSMVRAIQLLAPDIRAMKSKGYTMDQVAQMLTSSGIPIAGTTLKSYLSRFVVAPVMKPLRKGKRGGTNNGANPLDIAEATAERTWSASPDHSRPTAATPIGAVRGTSAPGARLDPVIGTVSPKEPAKGPTSPPAQDHRSRYANFIPREDTKDI
jgi:hypothetical protein